MTARKDPPGAAFASIREKTSVGRPTGRSGAVTHPEDAECEGLPVGGHELTKTADAQVFCRWRGDTWAVLDEALNGHLKGRRRA